MGSLDISFADEKVALRGTIPSQAAKAALMADATKIYGASGLTEQLRPPSLEAEAESNWLEVARKAIAWSKYGAININNKVLTLRGEQPTDAMKTQRFEYTKKTLGEGWQVIDEMTVRAATPAPSPTPKSENSTTAENLKAFKNITFETNSATITAEGIRLLDEAAQVMATTGATRYEVGGHTDGRGSDAANQNLSERRADAVRKHLMDQGIAPERLQSQGYGESKPVAPNDTPSNLARNRRIEFTELK
jgi:OmpA-OmpF porin, OOP family